MLASDWVFGESRSGVTVGAVASYRRSLVSMLAEKVIADACTKQRREEDDGSIQNRDGWIAQ